MASDECAKREKKKLFQSMIGKGGQEEGPGRLSNGRGRGILGIEKSSQLGKKERRLAKEELRYIAKTRG